MKITIEDGGVVKTIEGDEAKYFYRSIESALKFYCGTKPWGWVIEKNIQNLKWKYESGQRQISESEPAVLGKTEG